MQEISNKSIKLSHKLAKELIITDILSQYGQGQFRWVVKTRIGMTVTDSRAFENPRICADPAAAISSHKKGALQTVQFKPDGADYWLTIFSRIGKRVKLIDEAILATLRVGVINNMFSNTNLMDMTQYKLVGASTWASWAFVQNREAQEANEPLEAQEA